jgi:protein phosphatase
MKGLYKVAMKSIVGTRDEQQDCAYYKKSVNGVFAVVCDGMGGMVDGQIASTVTVEKTKELYLSKDTTESIPAFFFRIVDILDERVCSLKNSEGERLTAGTTIVAAVIENNNLYWLSVGDSRLYLLRGTEIVQVTRDHNNFLSPDYTNHESKGDGKRASNKELLVSFIGVGGVELMDYNEKPFTMVQGDTVLLTTDGLYKALPDDEIRRLLQKNDDIEVAVHDLIEQSTKQSKGFQDNTTCIAIRFS